MSTSLAANKLHVTSSVWKAMEEQGIFSMQSRKIYRNPISQERSRRYFGGSYRRSAKNLRSHSGRMEGWRFSYLSDTGRYRKRKNAGVYGIDGAGDP